MHPHDDPTIADRNTLVAKTFALALLTTWNEPPVCGNDTPPWNTVAMTAHYRTDSARGPRLADLGRHFAVSDDLTRIQRAHDRKHSFFELCPLRPDVTVAPTARRVHD